ncbi:hypothetical protein [Castellaniella sp.]|uniref:hypothetical protein n=1 Tax=Castellaniella sp. TaxID=1955812 RepID=UPI003A938B50
MSSAYMKVKEDLYWRIRNLLDESTRVALIPTRAREPREERAEFLIDQDASHSDSEIALTVAGQRKVLDCGVQSNTFFMPWGQDGYELQVFLHRIEPESFDFALFYRAYERLGDVLAAFAAYAGFRVTVNALAYVDPATQRSHGICVTRDFIAMLTLFGLDVRLFQAGMAGAFEDEAQFFAFLTQSPYFCRAAYAPPQERTRGKPSRRTMVLRDFSRWLGKQPPGVIREYPGDQAALRAEMLTRVRRQFPALAVSLDGVTSASHEQVFNSPWDRRTVETILVEVLGDAEVVRREADITSRPAFRMAIRRLKERFEDRRQYQAWLASQSRAAVIAEIQALRDNLKPTGYRERG